MRASLRTELATLSNGNTVKELLSEWEPSGTEEDGTYTECLCGKEDIIENYRITNKETGAEAIVGSKCIQQFESDEFKVSYTIGQYTSGRLKNIPVEAIRFATRKEAINQVERGFMLKVHNKTKSLSSKQERFKKSVTTKILKCLYENNYNLKIELFSD